MNKLMSVILVVTVWLVAETADAALTGPVGKDEHTSDNAGHRKQVQLPVEPETGMPAGEVLPPPDVIRVGADGACQFDNIQDAIDAASGPTVVRIARNASYSGSWSIEDKSITLRGGYEDCGSGTPTHPDTPVHGRFHIINWDFSQRRNVTLDRLLIQSGSAGLGGGMLIERRVRVSLVSTVVANNQAINGGGIFVASGGADDTLLVLGEGSAVIGNTASGQTHSSGGGILCMSSAVEIAHPSVLIATNQSLGDDLELNDGSGAGGGGIYLNNCRLESVAGGAFAGIATNLSMGRGGGIHATNGSEIVFYHAPGAVTGPEVHGNSSQSGGGGISLHASSMQAQELAVYGNSATEAGIAHGGGGILARANSQMTWVRDPAVLSEATSNCAPERQSCNRLSDNQAGSAAAGLLLDNSTAVIRQLEISGNESANQSVAIIMGEDTVVGAEGVLITGNTQSSGDLIMVAAGGWASFSHATIADNQAPVSVIRGLGEDVTIRLYSSVVSEAGGVTVEPGSADFQAGCVMSHETLSLWAQPAVSERPHADRTALFMNPDAADYRPNPFGQGQLLIDYCDDSFTTTGFVSEDGLLQERGIELAEIPNRPGALSGPFDIGAYELPAVADITIFSDRFEQ